MDKYVVTVGIVVSAESEAEAIEGVMQVLIGDEGSGVIAGFNVQYADLL